MTILGGLNEFVVKFVGPTGSKSHNHCPLYTVTCGWYQTLYMYMSHSENVS